MKKILILITLLLTTTAFAVEYSYADKRAAYKAGYDADLAYTESVTGIAEGETLNCTLEQWKITTICNIKLGAFHAGKTPEFVAQARKEAADLFYANASKLTDGQVYQLALRLGDFSLAASKFNSVKSSLNAVRKIEDSLKLYKANTISKDVAIATLIDASDDIIKDNEFVALAKAVDSVPSRDNSGELFMTSEQKKTFYGNFKDYNKVTKASADFLGACVTQYNLVK